MTVSSIGASSAAMQVSPIISVLKASQSMQSDMVERLISTGIEAELQADKMEQIGQILDVYA